MGGCQSTGTALIQASGSGDKELVKCVLERNPHYAEFKTWRSQNSPMLAAAVRGQRDVLRLLYLAAVSASGHAKAKRCLDLQNHRGYTPLMAANRNGHSSCVRYLVHCGADPLLRESSRGQTCLHLAAEGSHNSCIVKLLANGEVGNMKVKQGDGWSKFVDCADDCGMSALHIAVRSGCISTVWCLLRGGASLSTVVTEGKHPSPLPPGSNVLHIAAASCDTNMVKWLLDYQESHCPGLDLRQAENSAGSTPFGCAGHAGPLVHILLDPGLPYSTISSLWHSRGIIHDRNQWRKEAEIALQRAQLLFQSSVLALKERDPSIMITDAIKDIKALAKQIAEVRSALPEYAVSREEAHSGQFLFSRVSASLGAFESIVNLASNLARKLLKDGLGDVAADDISVLQAMTASLHARVLQGNACNPGQEPRSNPSSLLSSTVDNPALQTLLSSVLLDSNNFDSLAAGSIDGVSGDFQDEFKGPGTTDAGNPHQILHKEEKNTDECASSPLSARSVGYSILAPESMCAICMDRREDVRFKRCGHKMCINCSVKLCSQYTLQESSFVKCPFCRQLVVGLSPLSSGVDNVQEDRANESEHRTTLPVVEQTIRFCQTGLRQEFQTVAQEA